MGTRGVGDGSACHGRKDLRQGIQFLIIMQLSLRATGAFVPLQLNGFFQQVSHPRQAWITVQPGMPDKVDGHGVDGHGRVCYP